MMNEHGEVGQFHTRPAVDGASNYFRASHRSFVDCLSRPESARRTDEMVRVPIKGRWLQVEFGIHRFFATGANIWAFFPRGRARGRLRSVTEAEEPLGEANLHR